MDTFSSFIWDTHISRLNPDQIPYMGPYSFRHFRAAFLPLKNFSVPCPFGNLNGIPGRSLKLLNVLDGFGSWLVIFNVN